MKLRDKMYLSITEFKYDKKEWIISEILHILLFACVLFLCTVSFDLDGVIGDYLDGFHPDGYGCALRGYNENETKELEKLGFSEFYIEEGEISVATASSIKNAWKYKIKALSEGKDIYYSSTEEDLMVLLFVTIVFGLLSIILFVLMCANIVNALGIKISKREKYIDMLIGLGMSKKECSGIYIRFFLIRNLLALLIAGFINAICIKMVNDYMKNAMRFTTLFSIFHPIIFFTILILCIVFMIIVIRKGWRKKYE